MNRTINKSNDGRAVLKTTNLGTLVKRKGALLEKRLRKRESDSKLDGWAEKNRRAPTIEKPGKKCHSYIARADVNTKRRFQGKDTREFKKYLNRSWQDCSRRKSVNEARRDKKRQMDLIKKAEVLA